MRYVTDQHPQFRGVWVLCDDGRPVRQPFGAGPVGYALALRAIAHLDRDVLLASGEDEQRWVSSPAIAFEGVPTGDRRQLDVGSVSWRELPLPHMLQVETNYEHLGAVIAGRVETITVQDGLVTATGVWLDTEEGRRAAELARSGTLDGVSLDPGAVEAMTEIIETDEDGWPVDWLDHFTEYEVAGLTQTPFPAFADARIAPADAVPVEEDVSEDEDEPELVVAAGGYGQPPVNWFEDPGLTELTPLTITDEGRVFGHIAAWNTCHVGILGTCVTPPRGGDYSGFTLGAMRCAEGCDVPVGTITMSGGHAPSELGTDADAVRAHYDDVSTAMAYVAVGEDDFGPWVAGTLAPGVTDEQVVRFRAAKPSGDWRNDMGSGLRLLAVHAVNMPGFPVARAQSVVTASGDVRVDSLVAGVSHTPVHLTVEERLAAVDRRANEQRVAALSQRVMV